MAKCFIPFGVLLMDKTKPGAILTYVGPTMPNEKGILIAIDRDVATVLLWDLSSYMTCRYSGHKWLWRVA